MGSLAYHLSNRGNKEIIFVNPRNNMISDMPVLFQAAWEITWK